MTRGERELGRDILRLLTGFACVALGTSLLHVGLGVPVLLAALVAALVVGAVDTGADKLRERWRTVYEIDEQPCGVSGQCEGDAAAFPEPPGYREKRAQIKISAEAGLPWLDMDEGEVRTAEWCREWVAKDRAIQDARAKVLEWRRRIDDFKTLRGGYDSREDRLFRREVWQAEATLAELEGRPAPPAPGRQLAAPRPGPDWGDHAERRAAAASAEPPTMLYGWDDGVSAALEKVGDPPVRAVLSDGSLVRLTKEDLALLRTLHPGHWASRPSVIVDLPSGVQITGQDAAMLSGQLRQTGSAAAERDREANEVLDSLNRDLDRIEKQSAKLGARADRQTEKARRLIEHEGKRYVVEQEGTVVEDRRIDRQEP